MIDPSQGVDEVRDIAFRDGKVAATGQGLAAEGRDRCDVSGQIVTPRPHRPAHPRLLGAERRSASTPRRFARSSGRDHGGGHRQRRARGNFPGFRRHVIDAARTRILVYLHVSFAGIYGFTPRIMVGESHDFRLMAPQEAIPVIEGNRDVIVGIKVRIGRHRERLADLAP